MVLVIIFILVLFGFSLQFAIGTSFKKTVSDKSYKWFVTNCFSMFF